jgi:hypothetical protein
LHKKTHFQFRVSLSLSLSFSLSLSLSLSLTTQRWQRCTRKHTFSNPTVSLTRSHCAGD